MIAIFVVTSFDFCFADEDAVGLVTSSGSGWGCRAGRAFGLFSVRESILVCRVDLGGYVWLIGSVTDIVRVSGSGSWRSGGL